MQQALSELDAKGGSPRYLVFDPEIEDWLGGRAFDPAYVGLRPGGRVWATLASEARDNAWIPLTIDQFASMNEEAADAYLVVQLYRLSALARQLIASGRVHPAVAVCLESPLTAPDFYVSRGADVAQFDHVFAFTGALANGFAGSGELHTLQWPYERPADLERLAWSNRRFLTLISSNRRSDLSTSPNLESWRLLSYLRSTARRVFTRWKVHGALGRLPEFYWRRLEVIEYFAAEAEFDLWGFDWEKPVPGAESRFRVPIDASYQGTIPHGRKCEVLSRYRFAFCSENTAYPGYVTEKLLDCMVAGCVPLYLGAPDIERFVPSGAYVDVRKFETTDDLSKYLHAMNAAEAERILECGRSFFVGPGFDSFDQAITAKRIMTAIDQSYRRVSERQ